MQWHSVMVEVAGGGIATQANGTPADPAILLIGGATRSRDWWADDFCSELAADPLFPPAHGQALAAAMDAPLLMLDGVGHQTPRSSRSL